MILSNHTTHAIVRVGPGDDVMSGILKSFVDTGASAGTLITAVGSIATVDYVVVAMNRVGDPVYSDSHTETGAIEILSLQGQLGFDDEDRGTSHIHGSFVRTDGTTFGGHVIAATALVTVEMTVLLMTDVRWRRSSTKFAHGYEMPVLVPESVPT